MTTIGSDYPRLAVKEHDATRLHWDVRIEDDLGRLLSFALDSPPHLNPNEPIKAVWTGYHQPKYLLSEWIVWKGVKKPGPTAIWDWGVYKLQDGGSISEQLADGFIRIFLVGQRLNGIFSLRHVGPRPEDWLWTKEWDEFVDVNRTFENVLTPEKIEELRLKAKRKRGKN